MFGFAGISIHRKLANWSKSYKEKRLAFNCLFIFMLRRGFVVVRITTISYIDACCSKYIWKIKIIEKQKKTKQNRKEKPETLKEVIALLK